MTELIPNTNTLNIQENEVKEEVAGAITPSDLQLLKRTNGGTGQIFNQNLEDTKVILVENFPLTDKETTSIVEGHGEPPPRSEKSEEKHFLVKLHLPENTQMQDQINLEGSNSLVSKDKPGRASHKTKGKKKASDAIQETSDYDMYEDESEEGEESISDDDGSYVVDDEISVYHESSESDKYEIDISDDDDLGVDDGEISTYKSRMRKWALTRRRLRVAPNSIKVTKENEMDIIASEIYMSDPKYEDAIIDNTLKIPGEIYHKLFGYQKLGVEWFWKRHQNNQGGILGDEMGLGKTVQMIAFLAGLFYSNQSQQATIIICPATLMFQWVKELHNWWPPIRVGVLHSTGRAVSSHSDEDSGAAKLIKTFTKKGPGHVIVTTYESVKKFRGLLLGCFWEYVVLDEGHKIRNPDAEVTLTVKEFKSTHRIILSGTPIQNNYKELWSLMDFVAPGKFGTLPVFEEHLANKVIVGGYRHANEYEVQTAYYCARIMADFVEPYMLRRTKAETAIQRPKQTDQVLFCKLTPHQRKLYQDFLKEREMKDFVTKSKDYGNCERSGKMLVVKSLLEMWKPKGHRVLLFSQSTEMLDILEKFIKSLRYKYRRLDGTTPISKRPFLVEEFNTNDSIYILLLTTKVGGVGLNLTGADRIIIYDPDWNPSNDDQATERAARPGQSKNVSIYRLMTFGTIEEKIYHRQLFKRMMSNKITRKPSKDDIQFEAEDLYDLFSLGNPDAKDTETSYMFGDAEIGMEEPEPKRRKPNSHNSKSANNRSSTSRSKSNPIGNSLLAHMHNYNELSTFYNPTALLDSEEEGEIRETPSKGDAFGGVVRVEDRNKEQKEEKEESEEKDLLQMLYKTAGLHSVFKHDKVLGAKSTNNSSVFEKVIDEKARKAAKEAKEALEISRRQLRNLPLGTLTWTGQSGKGGIKFDPSKLRKNDDPWDFSQNKRF
ncbi:1322_t:CDS:2 [Ambispora gerdemannii]|uniref:1322_t:CDS:1 n=1 Tax=Ambispora gerdemannii TaxID=144530 RepID=A0A9N8VRY0_9GLOM|nr:1322_t:CDS:2 [Ambispora gerdemannii]